MGWVWPPETQSHSPTVGSLQTCSTHWCLPPLGSPPPPRPTHPQGKGEGLPLLEKKILQAIIFNAQRESSSQMPDRRPNFSSAKIIICTRKRRCCCCRLPPPPKKKPGACRSSSNCVCPAAASLTFPGFQQHRVGHNILQFHNAPACGGGGEGEPAKGANKKEGNGQGYSEETSRDPIDGEMT